MKDNRGSKLDANGESIPKGLTRRRMLQGAGGLAAVAAFPARSLAYPEPLLAQDFPAAAPVSDLTGRLARYMVEARDRSLPANVALEGKHHILDTLGAMVSGSRLKPGEMAIRFVRAQGGVPEASVIGTKMKTSAINAALANGMCGHADETDDVELVTKAHPGCSSVAAALAMAEREGRSGMDFLRAVVLGYDVCCRFLMALGPNLVRATHRSAEGYGATFGSVAAAASLARLDEVGMRYALSYAAQQVSGLWSWTQDTEHIEKAFDFAGMGARNGVTSATMVQAGFTGVRNVFDCEHNVLEALSSQPHREQMVAGLGARYWITETSIKTFSVGYPIQSALDAFFILRREYGLNVDNVERIVVRLPADGAGIVDNSAMPDVNCQYIMAVALLDGTVSFANSHSREHMADPQVRAVKQRVQLVADRKLMDPAAPRSGIVEVTLKDGRTVSHFTRFPPGTKQNPISTEGVNAKVRDLMAPVLGAERTAAFIQSVNFIEDVRDMRELRPLFTL
ncbi:MAG TPA: MmgE/PrpD family protein [Candidatus Dormibacteraeota bacterium]|nr:MmgE/PrpD family protein [Candidatus Dormibacteraeota bacterium]